MNKNKGFTLIELMITVAIVGVLATIAISSYITYTIKSQVTEGISLVSGGKPLISEYYELHNSFPSESDNVGYNSVNSKFISSTEIEDGNIIATFGNEANSKISGRTLTLTPTYNGTNLIWECSSTIDEKYLPTTCRNIPGDDNEVPPTDPTTPTDPTNPGDNNGENPNNPTDPDDNGEPETPQEPEVPVTPPEDTTGKSLTPEQRSKYPEVDAAYQRYFNSANQVTTFNNNAAALRAEAQQAQQAGNQGLYQQLMGRANNEEQQANNYSVQMQQSLTQYQQAIEIYKGRNNGTLPGDFPVAPRV